MAQTVVTTLTPDELADLLAPRLAERLAAEWAAHYQHGKRRGRARPNRKRQLPAVRPAESVMKAHVGDGER